MTRANTSHQNTGWVCITPATITHCITHHHHLHVTGRRHPTNTSHPLACNVRGTCHHYHTPPSPSCTQIQEGHVTPHSSCIQMQEGHAATTIDPHHQCKRATSPPPPQLAMTPCHIPLPHATQEGRVTLQVTLPHHHDIPLTRKCKRALSPPITHHTTHHANHARG
jgi:hypothetical protein